MMKYVAILRNASLSAALLLASSAVHMTGATAAASESVPGRAVGNLTNALELAAIKALADAEVQPHFDNREQIETAAEKEWKHKNFGGRYQSVELDGKKFCLAGPPPEEPLVDRPEQPLVDAAPDIYAKVLAYHLTNDEDYASKAREHLLELTSSSGFDRRDGDNPLAGGNECILKLAESMPVYIESALLLEGSAAWTDDDRAKFGDWLRDTVYHYTAWASRKRKNNWGAAGSAASWAIAHYLSASEEVLREKKPDVIELTPAEAMAAHEGRALDRMRRKWAGDSMCDETHGIHGIQPGGGIPDELRRGDGNCELAFLTRGSGSPHGYQAMHTTLLILHGEMLRRHGSNSIFNYTLPEGHNAIQRAILFVIRNPVKPDTNSFEWVDHHRGALFIAHNALGNARICEEAKRATTFRSGGTLPYAKLTHPFSCDDGSS